jgi:hypothetical protein
MEHRSHEQNLLNAEKARNGLADDIRDFNQVGKRLMRSGERKVKNSLLVFGATALGGLAVGFALGRASSQRRGPSLVGDLLGKATTAFATTLAIQLVRMLVAKKGVERVRD